MVLKDMSLKPFRFLAKTKKTFQPFAKTHRNFAKTSKTIKTQNTSAKVFEDQAKPDQRAPAEQ